MRSGWAAFYLFAGCGLPRFEYPRWAGAQATAGCGIEKLCTHELPKCYMRILKVVGTAFTKRRFASLPASTPRSTRFKMF